MTQRPLVSIIVLTHNKAQFTRLCLWSLLGSTYRPLEFVIVDNGSTDETPRLLEEFATSVKEASASVCLIRNENNVGCSTGRNQGMERSRGEYVVFVDNDVMLRTRTWCERMVAALEADHTLGAVGPKLVYPFPPFLIQFAGGNVSPSGRVEFAGRGEPRDETRFNSPRCVQCFITACMMVPQRVIQKVGEFDEAFNPVQYEDIDYCYRIREQGWQILYLPEVEFYHFENSTTAGTPRLNYRYLTVRNGMRFKRKWQHMFSREGGPDDVQIVWKDIPQSSLEDLPHLDILP